MADRSPAPLAVGGRPSDTTARRYDAITLVAFMGIDPRNNRLSGSLAERSAGWSRSAFDISPVIVVRCVGPAETIAPHAGADRRRDAVAVPTVACIKLVSRVVGQITKRCCELPSPFTVVSAT